MDILESSFLEEVVGGVCKVVSNSSDSSKEVSSRSQVGDFSQELFSVFLFGKGKLASITQTYDLNCVFLWITHLQLKRLTFSWTGNQSAYELERRSVLQFADFFKGIHGFEDHNLKIIHAGTVTQCHEAAILTLSHTPCPSGNLKSLVKELFMRILEFGNSNSGSTRSDWNYLFWNWNLVN